MRVHHAWSSIKLLTLRVSCGLRSLLSPHGCSTGSASAITRVTVDGFHVVLESILCLYVYVYMHRHGPHEEEEVVYERLPSDIAQRQVLLMDPLVGTGRTACRAVEVSRKVGPPGDATGGDVRNWDDMLVHVWASGETWCVKSVQTLK